MPHLVRRLLVFIAPVFLYVFIFKIALSGHNPYIYQDTDELAARYIVNVLGNATEKGNNSLTSATKSKVVDHAATQRLTNVSQAEHHVESKNKSVASKSSAKPTVTTTTKTPASKRKPKRRKPRTRFSQLVYSNLSCPFDPPNLGMYYLFHARKYYHSVRPVTTMSVKKWPHSVHVMTCIPYLCYRPFVREIHRSLGPVSI